MKLREQMLKDLIKTYGDETVRAALGVNERTFALYGKNGKLPRHAKLVRVEYNLSKGIDNAND